MIVTSFESIAHPQRKKGTKKREREREGGREGREGESGVGE